MFACTPISNPVVVQDMLGEKTAEIDKLVSSVQANGSYPALAVSVRRDNELVYENAFGVASLELTATATPNTVFAIGSLTKAFTMLLIAQLVVDDKIDLDAPIKKYLEDYEGPGASVTIRQLMNHTSGIVSFTAKPSYPDKKLLPIKRQDVRDMFEHEPLMFESGTGFSYSNSGAYLLGLVAEAVTGSSYGALLRVKVFEPLGLKATFYPAKDETIPDRALGYTYRDGEYVNALILDPELPFASGVLLSTVKDVQEFVYQVYGKNVFGKAILDILYTRDRLHNGEELAYALGGIVFGEFAGQDVIFHTGGIDGFASVMAYYLESGYSIVVLGSTMHAQPTQVDLEKQIARILFDVPLIKPSGDLLDPSELKKLIGSFEAKQPGIPEVSIIEDMHGISVNILGTGIELFPIRLLHVKGREFVAENNDSVTVNFSEEAGTATGLVLTFGGGEYGFSRATE